MDRSFSTSIPSPKSFRGRGIRKSGERTRLACTNFSILPCWILNDDLQTGLLLGRELRLNQPIQMRRGRWLIEPLNDFIQETGDDEALGN